MSTVVYTCNVICCNFNDNAKEIEAAIALLEAALKGRTIGIASGTVYTLFIDTYFKGIAQIREYNNSADAILELQSERIDAVFDDVTSALQKMTSVLAPAVG